MAEPLRAAMLCCLMQELFFQIFLSYFNDARCGPPCPRHMIFALYQCRWSGPPTWIEERCLGTGTQPNGEEVACSHKIKQNRAVPNFSKDTSNSKKEKDASTSSPFEIHAYQKSFAWDTLFSVNSWKDLGSGPNIFILWMMMLT